MNDAGHQYPQTIILVVYTWRFSMAITTTISKISIQISAKYEFLTKPAWIKQQCSAILLHLNDINGWGFFFSVSKWQHLNPIIQLCRCSCYWTLAPCFPALSSNLFLPSSVSLNLWVTHTSSWPITLTSVLQQLMYMPHVVHSNNHTECYLMMKQLHSATHWLWNIK